MHGYAQPSDHEVIFDYSIRMIVAGSRGYDDYDFFSKAIWDTIALYDEKILFISGAARSGADRMIIRFCQENGFPWVEFPADWDNLNVPGCVIRYTRNGKPYNAKAGHDRNTKMGKVATHLLAFWDGISLGTKNMIADAGKRDLSVTTILIDAER